MTLAITTTLTLMGMMNSVFNNSPITSYLKAIDCFLVGCFGFTFAVLAEFCAVIALMRTACNERSERKRRHKQNLARRIERWAKLVLPLMFAIAIGTFFVVVLSRRPFEEDDGLRPMKRI